VGHIFLAIAIAVVGVFFLATGSQGYADGFSGFGWTAIGAGLIAGAIFVFVALKPERDERRRP
jgi:hypothetical protein